MILVTGGAVGNFKWHLRTHRILFCAWLVPMHCHWHLFPAGLKFAGYTYFTHFNKVKNASSYTICSLPLYAHLWDTKDSITENKCNLVFEQSPLNKDCHNFTFFVVSHFSRLSYVETHPKNTEKLQWHEAHSGKQMKKRLMCMDLWLERITHPWPRQLLGRNMQKFSL